MEKLDLLNVDSGLVSLDFLALLVGAVDHLDGLIESCSIDHCFGVRLVGHTRKLEVLDAESGLGILVLGVV
jgi:hypothetical protein